MLLVPFFTGFRPIEREKSKVKPVKEVKLQTVYPDLLSKAFYSRDEALDRKVDSLYALMTDEERAAQMIMVASTASAGDFRNVRDDISGRAAGSVLLLKGSREGFRQQVMALNASAGKAVLPPFYACDCEPSLLYRKWDGAPVLTPAGEQETDELIVSTTKEIAAEMQRMGAVLNFAPVVDNGTNKAIIGSRAFGNTEAEIFPKASLFIRTMQNEGIATTVKHFPGHGSVKGDSHKNAVYIDGPLTELEAFRKTIRHAHPLVVMVGHITIRRNETYNTNGVPSSISRKIVTDLLRKELGFNGVIATDAMNMKAVSQFADADWKAVLAGADLVVMPSNAAALNRKIVAALRQEGALQDQLEASVKRIMKMKLVTRGEAV